MENFIAEARKAIIAWNQKNSERQKMQDVYLLVGIIGVLIAGLITLVNPIAGHYIVLAAIFMVVVFIANAIVWHLLNSAVLSKLPSRPRKK